MHPSINRFRRQAGGLTMRFFLQAREFSSLGVWIGHYATVYSQIDDPRNFASAAL